MNVPVTRLLVAASVLALLPALPANAAKPLPPSVSVTGVTLIEAWGRRRSRSRTGSLKKASSVTLTTTASDLGNAASAGEYVAGSQVVSFARNVSSVNVSVNAVDDTAAEGDETFRVVLSNPSNATLDVARDYVTVVDDDQPGTYTVPNGQRLLVQNLLLAGCHSLAARLVDAAGATITTLASGASCSPGTTVTSFLWLNESGGPVAARLALDDVTCGGTYYSDGTGAADHASAWDSSELDTPTGVAITDAGDSCAMQTAARQPGAQDPGNVQAAGIYVVS